MTSLFVTLWAAVGLLGVSRADEIGSLSFHEPFNELDGAGTRVLDDWHVGGDATVQEHYVRITPERQSKQGHVWSLNTLGSDEFSAVLQFRLSGSGATLFGDGLALWVTQNANYWSGGDFHGSPSVFTGIGVILDTYKNAENAETHRDVALVYNDGTRSVEDMYSTVVGCDADMRYHEERADFSVSNSSRIKVTYLSGHVKILIDARATGVWEDCADLVLPLPEHWAQSAHLAMTASTGDLADNHDILGLAVYTSYDDVHGYIRDQEVARDALPAEERHRDQVSLLEDQVKTLKKELEFKLNSFNDGLKLSLEKLREQEQEAENRIAMLEEKLSNMVESHIDRKIGDQRESILEAVTYTVGSMEDNVMAALGGSGGWKIPFFILTAVFFIGGFMIWKKYEKLAKSHLL